MKWSSGLLCAIVLAPCVAASEGGGWEDRLIASYNRQVQGDSAGAIAILDGLVAEAERNPADSERHAVALHNLALAHQERGDYSEAERCFIGAVAILERTRHGGAGILRPLNNLVSLYLDTEQYGKAATPLRRLAGIFASLADPPAEELAQHQNSAAAVAIETGQFAEADALLAQAVPLAQTRLGPEHPAVAALLNTCGISAARQGRWPEAAARYEQALAILRKTHGPDHPVVARQLTNIATAYRRAARPSEGEAAAAEAAAVFETRLGPDSPALAAALLARAGCLRDLKRAGDAKPLEKRARAIIARRGKDVRLNSTVDISALRRPPR